MSSQAAVHISDDQQPFWLFICIDKNLYATTWETFEQVGALWLG